MNRDGQSTFTSSFAKTNHHLDKSPHASSFAKQASSAYGGFNPTYEPSSTKKEAQLLNSSLVSRQPKQSSQRTNRNTTTSGARLARKRTSQSTVGKAANSANVSYYNSIAQKPSNVENPAILLDNELNKTSFVSNKNSNLGEKQINVTTPSRNSHQKIQGLAANSSSYNRKPVWNGSTRQFKNQTASSNQLSKAAANLQANAPPATIPEERPSTAAHRSKSRLYQGTYSS